MEIRNYIEEIVTRTAETLIGKDKHFCKCEQCKTDVVTYTLNHLKPKYASNVKGHALTEVDIASEQLQTEVTVQVLKAIEQVKKHPNH